MSSKSLKNIDLIYFDSADKLARTVAGEWLATVEAANQAGKAQTVALSGGKIANIFFSAIVQQAKSKGISLENVHFFWADERCVPPDDAESNFRIANELLFVPLNIAPQNIHRVRGEETPETAAKLAIEEIFRVVETKSGEQPILDMIFLGIGPDGHTASLFPGEPESVTASKAVYRPVTNSPKPPPNRVTLGYPAIAAARQVWTLVSGSGKEQALAESIRAEGKTPFARVLRQRAFTKIYSDIHLPIGR